jgi:hypothetical protein
LEIEGLENGVRDAFSMDEGYWKTVSETHLAWMKDMENGVRDAFSMDEGYRRDKSLSKKRSSGISALWGRK